MDDDSDQQQSPRKRKLEPSDETSGPAYKKQMESTHETVEEEQAQSSTNTVGVEEGIIEGIKDPHIKAIFMELAKIKDDQKMNWLIFRASQLIYTLSHGDSDSGENESSPAPSPAPVLAAENDSGGTTKTWADLCAFAERLELENCNNTIELSIVAMEGKRQIQGQEYERGDTTNETKTVSELFEYVKSEKAGFQYYYKESVVWIKHAENPSFENFQNKVAPIYPDTAEQISSLLRNLRDTYEDKEESGNKDEKGGGEPYIPDFVLTKPRDFVFRDAVLASQVPLSKSKALLVAGVSGTGKSWLTLFGLPKLCENSSFLFCTLSDDLHKDMKDGDVPAWMSHAMSELFKQARDLPELYQRISKSSMELNASRNDRAKKLFHDMCLEKITKADNKDLLNWWKGNGPTLGHLVVVLDECGKSLPFTRGVIDSCRDLAGELERIPKGGVRARAKKVKIVLAGTRLDTWSGSAFQNRAAHGTDPMKFEVVQMVKPDLNKVPTKISPADLGGWYSTILAENTRILMRAVIPTLCIPALTDHYYQQGDKTWEQCRCDDRVAAGSVNTLMKYGARLYNKLNGVSDLKHDKKRREFFSLLFCLFLTRSLKLMGGGERALFFKRQAERMETFHIETSEENQSDIFARGLALEDPTSEPNRAMEYLACHGEHLPLNIGDGLALEAALEQHLKEYYYSKTKEDPGTFTLKATWAPPRKTKKGDEVMSEPAATGITLSDDHVKDIEELAQKIIELLEAKEGEAVCSFHVILSQDISNAEGPDKMVISAYKRDGKVQLKLDLYQCKNYTKFKDSFREPWFHTVGLHINNGEMKVSARGTGTEADPKPAYCESYVSALVEEVAKKIPKCDKGSVELRAVVVPQSATQVALACKNSNRHNDLSEAGKLLSLVEKSEANVVLWTSDCMRPTIRVVKVREGEEKPKGTVQ